MNAQSIEKAQVENVLSDTLHVKRREMIYHFTALLWVFFLHTFEAFTNEIYKNACMSFFIMCD